MLEEFGPVRYLLQITSFLSDNNHIYLKMYFIMKQHIYTCRISMQKLLLTNRNPFYKRSTTPVKDLRISITHKVRYLAL